MTAQANIGDKQMNVAGDNAVALNESAETGAGGTVETGGPDGPLERNEKGR